jgi:class 3 adenylate cyclase
MRVLIAEDDRDSQVLLRRILEKEGFQVVAADDGRTAWETFQKEEFRLVITDWQMPEMGGVELCRKIRAADTAGYVYIILVTAREAKDDLVQAMDAGANDYVTKPYDRGELLARVRSGIRIVELEQNLSERNLELSAEQEKSERLLLSIFPRPVAERLKREPKVIADSFAEASVLFADIHDFAGIAAQRSPIEVVELLQKVFSRFDRVADQQGLEKIKTIGDSYMVAGGVPEPRPDHADAVAEMALTMQREILQLETGTGEPLRLRIGIDSGPVIAGVIGTARLAYDLWGETVSTAEQMKTYGLPGAIQVSASTFGRLREKFILEERGEFYVQEKGAVMTYLLTGRRGDPS